MIFQIKIQIDSRGVLSDLLGVFDSIGSLFFNKGVDDERKNSEGFSS